MQNKNNFFVLPNYATQKLIQFAKARFNQFEYDHPTNQDPKIRFCLYKIEEKLDQFLIEADNQFLRERHLKYLALIGFFWEMYHLTLNIDSEFSNILRSLLCEGRIGEHEDFPGQASLGINCTESYKRFKKENELHNIDQSNFELIEQKEFDEAYNALHPYFFDNNSLCQKATEIAKDFNNEKESSSKVDLKFNTNVLTNLHILLQNPSDAKAIDKHHQFTMHAQGHPSLKQAAKGALFGISGLLLIAATTATFFALCTIVWPTAISAVISSLLLCGLIMSGSAGGLIAMCHSFSLFSSIKRTGHSMKLQDFESIRQKTPVIFDEHDSLNYSRS